MYLTRNLTEPLVNLTDSFIQLANICQWLSGKESTANAGDVCSILGSGRSLEGGNDNLL